MEKKTVWNIEAIERELKRLDKITGLFGGEIPIEMNDMDYALGAFINRGSAPAGFVFSRCFFGSGHFDDEALLGVIRHEYAHYMDLMLYGKLGHGATWRQCCKAIGAPPERIYRPERMDYYRKKHLREEGSERNTDNFKRGDEVKDPMLGQGTVCDITGVGASRILWVNFGGCIKRMEACSAVREG